MCHRLWKYPSRMTVAWPYLRVVGGDQFLCIMWSLRQHTVQCRTGGMEQGDWCRLKITGAQKQSLERHPDLRWFRVGVTHFDEKIAVQKQASRWHDILYSSSLYGIGAWVSCYTFNHNLRTCYAKSVRYHWSWWGHPWQSEMNLLLCSWDITECFNISCNILLRAFVILIGLQPGGVSG